MSSVYLTSAIENANFYLESFVPRAAAHTLSWREIQDMGTSYRQRGVASVLLTMDAKAFHVNMMQSAGAFIDFLKHCPEDQKITSQSKPFFDALCGGYFDAAGEIVTLSRGTWFQGSEYQEDFLYAWFLMKLFFAQEPLATYEAMLAALDKAQAGAEPERASICRALLTKDATLFNEMLSILLGKRRDNIEAMIERGSLREEYWSWLRYFSSEGLALVRLAEHFDIATEQQYLHIPQPLRAPAPFVYDPAAWRVLDYSPQ